MNIPEQEQLQVLEITGYQIAFYTYSLHHRKDRERSGLHHIAVSIEYAVALLAILCSARD
jgi:hypothetical protein